LAGDFAGALADTLTATGATGGAALAASGLMALLEITNLRRTGAVFILGTFGLLLLLRGALFGAEALRFNINNQTKLTCAGSEIDDGQRGKPGF
jgi:hypothetical protein